ncbi:sodium/calcium exchanger 1-like isoform X2 [Clavelina lepadiformis]|uniref:sodium/calcium exchanger 1-like isoform X2 n=1 Tax=Clavelina lepadiformis TaxID=159417 RepID=UPI004041D2E7
MTSTNLSCPDFSDFKCNSGIVLPLINESIWSIEFRAILYLVGLLWSFVAIALVADAFMCAIEVITSQTSEVKVARPDKEEGFEIVQVRVWNDTVANLTLMALGSSAPEILLSIIEILGNNFNAGELGPGTIVGSASFNLLIIVAVCVAGIPNGDFRRIKRIKVFAVTAGFSIFAYVWLYIVLVAHTENEIELWEAAVTFGFFPVLVIIAFVADKEYCCGAKVKDQRLEIELGDVAEDTALMKRPKTEQEKMKDIVQTFMKSLDKPEKLSEEDASNIAALKMQEEQQHSRAWYRVRASRDLFAGQRINPHLSDNLQKLHDTTGFENGAVGLSPQHRLELNGILGTPIKLTSEIEFDAVSCSVMENCGTVKISVVRRGDLSMPASVGFETIDGTATASDDYVAVKDVLIFEPKETKKYIEIEIIDDNVWEPDETFFVKLSKVDSHNGVDDDYVTLGHKIINQVTIINDDEPGTIEFTKPSYLVKESVGNAYFPLQRTNGADGVVEVVWRTTDLNAKEGVHYAGKEGKVTFEHGEDVKNIELQIINDHETKKDENFQITLISASGGASLGHTQKTVVTVVGDDEFDGLVRRVVAKTHLKLQKMKLGSQSWADQFTQAMCVNGGDIENATPGDYIMHFLSFGFKVIVAFVPPPSIWNGWACFAGALFLLIGLTAVVGDLATIFGCLIGLEPTVTAITLVALGTSLPDLFASKTAATQERYADNCIGNVTGSNSVNVFLGLGISWLMGTIYHKTVYGTNFPVDSGSLAFSVALYSICAVLCVVTLMARRYIPALGKCELGGPVGPKWATAGFFTLLWILYVVLSALQTYNIIAGF